VTDDQLNEDYDVEAPVHTEEPPQYGVGPFTIREVALVGVWLVAFVVSFFSVFHHDFASVWTWNLQWILTIGLPTVAVFLIVLRRLSPQGIRRVGSLGIDQFASVAFSVAAVVWLNMVWASISLSIDGPGSPYSWVIWVELVLMLAGVVLTVFAPIVPVLEQDFRGRPEAPAHRSARPVRAVSPRPARAPRPAAAPESEAYATPAGQGAYDDTGAQQPVTDPGTTEATPTAAFEADGSRDGFERFEQSLSSAEPVHEAPARQQAFWALVPEERDVVDEIGIPQFRIGPTAWALVVEDRGDVFVVRHEDGRTGYLRDVSGITRG
jgi:hypothetical protein